MTVKFLVPKLAPRETPWQSFPAKKLPPDVGKVSELAKFLVQKLAPRETPWQSFLPNSSSSMLAKLLAQKLVPR